MEILSIIFWWNPLIYIFRKAIKETHEYLADAYAVLDNDIKNYGLILLGQSSSGIELALTNQFFNSLLKKRINMLHQKKSAGYKFSKYLLALPLLCFMVILFSASSLKDSGHELLVEGKPATSYDSHIHPVVKSQNVIDLSDNDNIPEELKDKLRLMLEENSIVDIKSMNKIYLELRSEFSEHREYIQKYLKKYAFKRGHKLDITEKEEGGVNICISDFELASSHENNELDESHELHEKNEVEEKDHLSIKTVSGKRVEGGHDDDKNKEYHEHSRTVIGIESPQNNILYIGAKNKIVIKVFNAESTYVDHSIDCDNYFEVDNVSFKDNPNTYSIAINATKATPKNQPCQITFNFDDGNTVTQSFHVMHIDDVDTEVIEVEEKLREPLSISGDRDMSKAITIYNGREIKLDEGDEVELDGKMTYYSGKEAIDKFGDKGENGVLVLDGKITSINNKKTVKNDFVFENPEKPHAENIKANKFDHDNYAYELKTERLGKGNPLVIIDGEISSEKELKSLDTKSIASINVLKNERAIETYGEKAKDGVIQVITSKSVGKTYTVTGRVFDYETQKPLIGANVIIGNTKTGTITDINGNYSLELVRGQSNIVASYVGYKTKKSAVTKACDLSFFLTKDDLDSTEKEYKEYSSTNVVVRGMHIDSAKVSPLFIIDGKAVPKSTSNNLNPEDIKKIRVLKKGEDIEPYGEKGKNGVILIDTKAGDFNIDETSNDNLKLDLLDSKPIIFIDGVERTEADLKRLNPGEIATINIYKDDKAKEKFGDKGSNNVIDVVLKSKIENVIVLTLVDGKKVKLDQDETVTNAVSSYKFSSELLKDKLELAPEVDQVDLYFTENNHELEKSMPLRFDVLNNPIVNNQVSFKYFSNDESMINATVLNMEGKVLQSKKINPKNNSNIENIEMNTVVSGVYLLQLKQSNKIVTKQIVIP